MKRDEQATAKKREIVQHAFDNFYDGGFHATGVDTVMADSGISKRTLYKYFPSKEDLIDAVLDHYGEQIEKTLFETVLRSCSDPREQILKCFDLRRQILQDSPLRGCLGLKAAQEFAGRHEALATHGKHIAFVVDDWFVDACQRGRFAQPEVLGKQIATLFQGAVLLSQVYGDTSPFDPARQAAGTLMNEAATLVAEA